MQNINKKLVFYISFSTILTINTQVYSYMNDFSRLLKEMANRQKMAIDKGDLFQVEM